MKCIEVVAAIIAKDGKFFATQRGYGDWKDRWEFPGGKIEKGETREEALIREIREELDTVIAVRHELGRVEYDYPQFHLTMYCFVCRVLEGELMLREHEAAKWLGYDELEAVDWLPADVSAVSLLKEAIQNGLQP